MALTKDTITANGIAINGAYIRAQYVAIADKTKALVTAAYYVNDASTSAFQAQSFEFNYVLDGENPIKQAYEHLKTLPEFLGTQDC
jgi:hypothetical protein